MKILVSMSGGIDSSVVAHLLAEQGHELIGIRFTLWSDPLAPPLAQILPNKCCNAQTAARAKRVAADLGIPLHIVNLEDLFYREVVEPFLDGYRNGMTPNPCIGCNRTIKFGKLLEYADEYGCELLATGHYARTAQEQLPNGDTATLLLEGNDASKDQSYYLYGLSQEQLRRVVFPLGSLQKREIFRLAQEFSVPYEQEMYRESQDLCFFPEKTPSAFLRRHLQECIRPGLIVRRDGRVVGTHKGLPLYTLGQRRGLDIGGLRIPLEVVGKDVSTNTIIVDEKDKTLVRSIALEDIHWISWKPDEHTVTDFECRIRSLSPRVTGFLQYEDSHRGSFVFHSPQGPLAPGQHAVFYRGEEVVGGGKICT